MNKISANFLLHNPPLHALSSTDGINVRRGTKNRAHNSIANCHYSVGFLLQKIKNGDPDLCQLINLMSVNYFFNPGDQILVAFNEFRD